MRRSGTDPADSAPSPLGLDLLLYLGSAGFALVTATVSTLPPHRAWGRVATVGYACAAGLVVAQLVVLLITRRGSRLAGAWPGRTGVMIGAFTATALLPLILQAVGRAAGRTDRAQEEVLVVEESGRRLLATGSPYLDRAEIAALPEADRLLGYTPYQPGMALFGVPRAAAGEIWWTDARVWFALATIAALLAAAAVGRRASRADGGRPAGDSRRALVRAGQAASVFPIVALTLATGGDDLPVLGLCLLALALAARERFGWSGIALGAAAGLKLFAIPVGVVLLVLALTRGRLAALRYALPATALPLVALLPALVTDRPAVVENVLAFPLGRGLVSSPARSPLPGYLLASSFPGGRAIALGLLALLAAGLAGWLIRRPPRSARAAAMICAIGLTGAISLLPATRFGYLLYPIAFAFAARALPAVASPGSADRHIDEPRQM